MKPLTTTIRVYPSDRLAIDRHRAKLGLRTSAEAVAALVKKHLNLKGTR